MAKYLFSGVVESGVPIKASCALTHLKIGNGEKRIKANGHFVRLQPLISSQKQWLVNEGIADGCGCKMVQQIRSHFDLERLYPRLLGRKGLTPEQRAHIRHIIKLIGGERVKQ